MSVEDSESRRFEPTIRLSFSGADLGPTSAPELFFCGFSRKFGTIRFDPFGTVVPFWGQTPQTPSSLLPKRDCSSKRAEKRAHSKLYLKILTGTFGTQTFMRTLRFHWHMP